MSGLHSRAADSRDRDARACRKTTSGLHRVTGCSWDCRVLARDRDARGMHGSRSAID